MAAGNGAGDWLAAARERLARRRWLVVAATVVLLALAVAGQLTLPWALASVALLSVAMALLPPGDPMPPTDATRLEAERLADDSDIRRFADVLADPCLILDRRSAILHRNAAAAEEFADLLPGVVITMALRAPALLGALDMARRSVTRQSFELHRTVPTETWHRVMVAPLDPADPSGLMVLTLQSLTEARRLETMRTDFIANASHELRTPLSALLGFIDTLLGPAANDAAARTRFLGVMRAQAVRMGKLVEDLLSLSRIEMRQHMRPTGRVDLKLLLGEVRAGLETVALESAVSVTLLLPEGDLVVTGDRDELYEVFENLIDNAIKYGGGGGRVEVSLGPAGRGGYAALVAVTDFGAGVEAVHVPRLTERFYRVDAESSRRKKGTGLGLAIVKHIVGHHRGQLAIRSEPGKGTRVEVLLPG